MHRLLSDALGVSQGAERLGSIGEVRLPPLRLGDDVATELAGVVGAGYVRADGEARVRHTGGESTPDLLRMRTGDAASAPDLVVLPGSHDDLLELLRLCSARRIAVVPFGGAPRSSAASSQRLMASRAWLRLICGG